MARYVNADEWVIIPVVKKMDDEPSELPITIADLIKRTTKKEPIYADVREVVHGHWIVTGRINICCEVEVICSECNDAILITDLTKTHFCPNCGAEMRGE